MMRRGVAAIVASSEIKAMEFGFALDAEEKNENCPHVAIR